MALKYRHFGPQYAAMSGKQYDTNIILLLCNLLNGVTSVFNWQIFGAHECSAGPRLLDRVPPVT